MSTTLGLTDLEPTGLSFLARTFIDARMFFMMDAQKLSCLDPKAGSADSGQRPDGTDAFDGFFFYHVILLKDTYLYNDEAQISNLFSITLSIPVLSESYMFISPTFFFLRSFIFLLWK